LDHDLVIAHARRVVERMATVETLKTDRTGPAVRIGRGRRLGRYLVLGEIGTGAMGVVYRAFDPDLNRKVALKVLRGQAEDDRRRAVARVRLRREAQTLARLMHPNVVAVFDVGAHDGDVFVAMELVEGTNLATWLQERPASVADVVELMLRAGEGLAAAHELGIVHRDFKPSNVLVAEDGRVAVGDFGLARPDTTEDLARDDATGDPAESATDGSLFDLSLTERGRAVGTPAYMAPEQHHGEAVDPRADQFAFCVTLYEALYGRRPFDALSPNLIAEHKRLGLARPPAARGPRGRVPRHVRRALARGLRPAANQRYPRLAGLLEQLRPVDRRPIWRGAAALAAVGAAFALSIEASSATATDPCEASATALEGAWDDDLRQATQHAFTATSLPYAADALHVVQGTLDTVATQWVAQHRDACEATWVRHEQSQSLLDRRMACLTEQRRQIAATTHLLAEADAPVIDRAAAMVIALDDPDACGDTARVHDAPDAPSAEQAVIVDAVRTQLATARAARRAGRHGDALRIAQRLAGRGDVEHPATRLDVEVFHGRMLDDDGESRQATEVLQHAAVDARAAGLARTEAQAWIELTRIVGGRLHDAERGALYGELALAATTALGGDDELTASARMELGEVAFRRGDDVTARGHLDEALRRRRAQLGDDHYSTAEARGRLAGVQFREGDLAGAAENLRSTIATYDRVFGPTHPRVAAPIGNLGLVLAAEGRHDEALVEMRRARQILSDSLGTDHPSVATADDSIAHTLQLAGRLEEAEAAFRDAIEGFDRTIGPDDARVAAPLLGLAETLLARHRADLARPSLERALALTAGATIDPVEAADIRFGLARCLTAGAERPRALELARSAADTYASELPVEDERQAAVRDWLAEHETDI
jgi:tetratricopeptide (TPR) repeat protein/predicted Ser/Thr protein kinase